MGVEPGPELRDLTSAILNRDPTLDLRAEPAAGSPPAGPDGAEPPVTPRQLPGSTADFVGREQQITEIKRLLSDGPGSQTAPHAVRLVAVSGRGGVGNRVGQHPDGLRGGTDPDPGPPAGGHRPQRRPRSGGDRPGHRVTSNIGAPFSRPLIGP